MSAPAWSSVGQGPPLLVLCPLSDAAIAALANQHRVLYPACAGSAAECAAVLDEAGTPSAIVVGGDAAHELALRRPARVSALVLLGTPQSVSASLRLPTLIVVDRAGRGSEVLRAIPGAEIAVADEAGWAAAILAFTANL